MCMFSLPISLILVFFYFYFYWQIREREIKLRISLSINNPIGIDHLMIPHMPKWPFKDVQLIRQYDHQTQEMFVISA